MARAAGLDELRQVHRRRNALPEKAIEWGLGAVVIIGLFLATRELWLAVVGLLFAAAVVIAGYRVLLSVGGAGSVERPRRIAVHQGGLVLDIGRSAPLAVAWQDITDAGLVGDEPQNIRYVVSYRMSDGRHALLVVGPFSGRRALIRSIEERTPVPVPWWPRVATAVAVIGLVALVVWQMVLPRVTTQVVAELPGSTDAFAAACESPGTAFSAAAAYAGQAPHPVVVFPDDVRWRINDGASPWYPVDPGVVQLVGCVERDGDADSSGTFCTFSTSNAGIGGQVDTEVLTRSWYQITVYEARTHRELGSVRLIGENEICPKFKVGNAQIYTTPTDRQLHTALDPHTLTTPS